MPNTRHKVLVYITHGDRLLVFREPDSPEAGIQVPGGTVGEGEEPAAAAMREAFEETGLPDLELRASLGEFEHYVPECEEIWRRHVYHLTCQGQPPARWRHQETDPSYGGPGPITFELFWVRLPDEVPPLGPGHEPMLRKLLKAVGLAANRDAAAAAEGGADV
jgi:8-oxo-dGTP diphosphatase